MMLMRHGLLAVLVLVAAAAAVGTVGAKQEADDALLLTQFREALEYVGSARGAEGLMEELRESGLGYQQVPVLQRPTSQGRKSAVAGDDVLPVVQMHGMGDHATSRGMTNMQEDIEEELDTYVLNLQIGDTALEDILNGFLMNLNDQVDYMYNVVSTDEVISAAGEFNAIGYSQGNLVLRGYLQRYQDVDGAPKMRNFISMHGPLAGVSGFPDCPISASLCMAFDLLLGRLSGASRIQEGLTQANYYRVPTQLTEYKATNIYLADLNQEELGRPSDNWNTHYRHNVASLENLVLVEALNDTVVIPRESEYFGSYADDSYDDILGMTETVWYEKDTFGLRSLDEAGKVPLYSTEGNHLDFTMDFLNELIDEYFT